MALEIRLFGGFVVRRDGTPVPLRGWSRKSQDLLKILLDPRGQVYPCDQLAESLWPRADPERARANLRNCVKELRRRLEPNLRSGLQSRFILTVPGGYCFSREAECRLDTEGSAGHLRRGLQAERRGELGRAVEEFEAAIGIFRGEYLPENRYDEWARPRREGWTAKRLEALVRLAECYARLGRPGRSVACLQQALEIERHSEEIYGRLMRYYYLAGEPALALQAYERCREALAELDAAPTPSLEALREQIRAGSVPGLEPPAREGRPVPAPLPLGKLPFVGREEEFRRVTELLRRAGTHGGRGGPWVFLRGEAGIGKTRLLEELAKYARRRGLRVFGGRCAEMHEQRAYHPIRSALQAGLQEVGREELEGIEPQWLAEAAELVPELRTRLPHLPPGLELPAGPKRRRLHRGLARVLGGLARPATVLVLDDLQWADPSTLEFLNDLMLHLPREPLVVLGAYRPEEVEGGGGLAELIRKGRAKKRLRVLSLKGLAPEAVERLLRGLAPSLSRPDRFGRRLHGETRGNPFFLLSVLQNLFETGAIRLDERGRWIADVDELVAPGRGWRIPQEVREVIRRRVERLGEEERRLLEWAAVVGPSFDRGLLQRAWPERGAEVAGLLRRLAQRGLVRKPRRGRGGYEFVHDKVREVVYEGLDPAVRRELHRGIAAALSESAEEEGSARLAHHYAQAGDFERAVHHGLRALRRAVAHRHWREGWELADRALRWSEELGAEEGLDRRFEILSHRVALCAALGRHREQERDTGELLALAGRLRDERRRARAYQERARWSVWVGRYPNAKAEALESLRLWRRLGDRAGERAVLQLLGRIHDDAGDSGRARLYLERALELARALGDRAGEASALNGLGAICTDLGRHEEAAAYYERAGRIWRALGDRNGEGSFLNNLGVAAERLGDYPKALDYFARAERLAEELELPDLKALSLYGRGWVYRDLGRYRQALKLCREARHLARTIREAYLEAHVLNGLGDVLRQLGDLERALAHHEEAYRRTEAEEVRAHVLHHWGLAHWAGGRREPARLCWERSLALAEGRGLRELEIRNRSWLGVLRFWAGDPEGAAHELGRAVDRMEAGGRPAPLLVEVHWNRFRVLTLLGREAEAQLPLETAYDALMAIADGLLEDAKARFLEGVPQHRHLLRARERLEAGVLSERQRRALDHVLATGSIANREHRRLCGVSNVTAAQDLRALEERGFLAMAGKGRSVRYIPA